MLPGCCCRGPGRPKRSCQARASAGPAYRGWRGRWHGCAKSDRYAATDINVFRSSGPACWGLSRLGKGTWGPPLPIPCSAVPSAYSPGRTARQEAWVVGEPLSSMHTSGSGLLSPHGGGTHVGKGSCMHPTAIAATATTFKTHCLAQRSYLQCIIMAPCSMR